MEVVSEDFSVVDELVAADGVEDMLGLLVNAVDFAGFDEMASLVVVGAVAAGVLEAAFALLLNEVAEDLDWAEEYVIEVAGGRF